MMAAIEQLNATVEMVAAVEEEEVAVVGGEELFMQIAMGKW